MASITIKNLPADLHRRLKADAAREHRSLNAEIIYRLRASLGPAARDVGTILREVDRLHTRTKNLWLTDEDLNRFRNEGRS